MNETINAASPTPEAREQIPGPILHLNIEGDFNVHLGQSKAPVSPASAVAMIAALATGSALRDSLGKQPDAQAKPQAPSIITRDAARPLKIMRDGHRVDARDSVSDHVALLFPDTAWMVGVDTLFQGDKKPFDSQQEAVAAAKAITLLGHEDWELADDVVYGRHVIDRRFHKPAADPNLYPGLLLTDTYWTSTVTPWSESSAFFVFLHLGSVGSNRRVDSGFGLACRRARQ